VPCEFLLPTAHNRPLPSWEMAQYLEQALPEAVEWQYWRIHCYPVRITRSRRNIIPIIQILQDWMFLTQHRLLDVQMGADLLFWYHYTQRLKQLILRDQYIPALKYRSTASASKASASGRKRKTAPPTPTFEIYPGWEIISDDYENLVQDWGNGLPLACCAGFLSAPTKPQLHDGQTLLQHFSEVLLTQIVATTELPTAFHKRIYDTLLQDCLDYEGLGDSLEKVYLQGHQLTPLAAGFGFAQPEGGRDCFFKESPNLIC
jgi:hypothetical protein